MKKQFILVVLMAIVAVTYSQSRYITKNGFVRFYSKTSLETIDAQNKQVSSILDSKSGEIIFSLLMKSFKFERALMEEHFNENYAESDKYPKATFKGKITNISSVDFSKDSTYNAEAEGDMTIHGVAKPVKTKGTIEIKDGKFTIKSKFNIKPEDYGIAIPSIVRQKISEQFEVTVDATYSPVK